LAEAEAATGKPAGVRLLVPPGRVEFTDRVAGPQAFDVAASVGDFLIARRGGAPAYQLAVVVDDAAQSVTEVVRGDDLLASTARQWLLQRALDLPHPSWAHVPLVTNSAGERLAKREASLALSELRARGTDPRRIVAWAARTAGIDAGFAAEPREIVAAFAIESVPSVRPPAPETF
jgi:glutamyl-tRNA synthetase